MGGGYVCGKCIAKVSILKPCCPYCGKPSIDGFTHARCRVKLGLNGLTAVWKYEGVVRKAILGVKYKFATEIVRELCGYLQAQLDNYYIPVSPSAVLVPVPIFWYKENLRGFNQCKLIAQFLDSESHWKYSPNLLLRNKPTLPQVGLEICQRLISQKGSFSVNPDFIQTLPETVVLVDDVYTTGTTLKEACMVLKKAGIRNVWGLTIAKS